LGRGALAFLSLLVDRQVQVTPCGNSTGKASVTTGQTRPQFLCDSRLINRVPILWQWSSHIGSQDFLFRQRCCDISRESHKIKTTSQSGRYFGIMLSGLNIAAIHSHSIELRTGCRVRQRRCGRCGLCRCRGKSRRPGSRPRRD